MYALYLSMQSLITEGNLEKKEIERICAMIEDGLYCDISKYKFVGDTSRYLKNINNQESFHDSEVRYLYYSDLKVFEYYHKWSEIFTRVGKDDDVTVYEDRHCFFMYHGVCVKAEVFNIDNNIGLPSFKYKLPERKRTSDYQSWDTNEVRELKYREDLTKEFQSLINLYIDSMD